METVPADPPVETEDDDREDVDPNPESPDIDAPTPAHPDSTPDDDAPAAEQKYGVQGIKSFIG